MVETGTTAGYRHPATNRSRRQREQAMTFHEYLAKARQDDAQRAGERDRLLRTARRARRTRRHHTGPTARARHLAALMFHRATALPGLGRIPGTPQPPAAPSGPPRIPAPAGTQPQPRAASDERRPATTSTTS